MPTSGWQNVGHIRGPQGEPGPPGEPGEIAYRHYQTVASTHWTVSHNLGFRPNVTAVDSAGEWIIPGTTLYVDDNTVQLDFSAAVGGEAYLS